MFQNAHQLFTENCLKNSIDCFVKQSIVFLQLVKTVILKIQNLILIIS